MSNISTVTGIVRLATIPATAIATLAAAGAVATHAEALMYTAAASAMLAMGCLTLIEVRKRRPGGACDTCGINEAYQSDVEDFVAFVRRASEVIPEGFRAGFGRQLKIIVGWGEAAANRQLRCAADVFAHEFDTQVTEAKEIFVSLTPYEAVALHASLFDTLTEKHASKTVVTIVYCVRQNSEVTPEIQNLMKLDRDAGFTVRTMNLKRPSFQQPDQTQLNFITIRTEEKDPKVQTLVKFHANDQEQAWGDFVFSSPHVFNLYEDLEKQLQRFSAPAGPSKECDALTGPSPAPGNPPVTPIESGPIGPSNKDGDGNHLPNDAVGGNRIAPLLNGAH